jgi:hypothetical protein
MTTVRERDPHPQAPGEEKGRDALLRHALTRASEVIAGLLADHPTAQDARLAARAWLRTWQAFQNLAALDRHTAELVALAGGAR